MAYLLSDLESLALTCKSEQSKEYILEAIRCYGATAYRGAIVNAWIAVVFDLIEKIRELSLAGDMAAREINLLHERYMDQIESNNSNGIKGALEFERLIIETCRDKLQFFDAQQFLDLERLRQDRHRCAHPSFQRLAVPYSPPAEQARLHIRNAIVHVLSQPPVQGKAALDSLKALVSSEYFPTDVASAISQLKHLRIEDLTESAIRGFIDLLVYSFLDKDDSLFYNGNVYAALAAAYQIFPVEAEDRLKKQLNKVIYTSPNDLVWGAFALATNSPFCWGVLEKASKDRITQFVESGPTAQVIRLILQLSNCSGLEGAVLQRVSRFSLEELRIAVKDYNLRGPAKSRALELLSNSYSWNKTNEIFTDIVFPLYDFLTVDDIKRVICMPTETQADLPGATSYSVFIDKVRASGVFEGQVLDQMLKDNGAVYLLRP